MSKAAEINAHLSAYVGGPRTAQRDLDEVDELIRLAKADDGVIDSYEKVALDFAAARLAPAARAKLCDPRIGIHCPPDRARVIAPQPTRAATSPEAGLEGVRRSVPKFDEVYPLLPQPIFDESPGYVEAYTSAWRTAFKNFYEPSKESGFISWLPDAAFSGSIFLFDSTFITQFTRHGFGLVPGVEALDNFYIKQYPSGLISREIDRQTGVDSYWANKDRRPLYSRIGFDTWENAKETPIHYIGRAPPTNPPEVTLDAINHPLATLAELESYRLTGDLDRLKRVYDPLVRYYDALRTHLRQGNGLYMTDWASFDNSPRNRYLSGGGVGVDTSSEMALFASHLAEIARLIGRDEDAPRFTKDFDELKELIPKLMWNDEKQFYVDLTVDGRQAPTKTVAGFFPLLAGVAPPEHEAALLRHLSNPTTFGSRVPVPTLSRDDAEFSPYGQYWRGGVWAPTNMLVLAGLERTGHHELARELALRYLDAMSTVFRDTGTFWELNAPDHVEPGRNSSGDLPGKDFVGWSGLGPIRLFIEYAIGLRASAPDQTVSWDLRTGRRVGLKQLRFGQTSTDLVAEPTADGKAYDITYCSNAPYRLVVTTAAGRVEHAIPAGQGHVRVAAA